MIAALLLASTIYTSDDLDILAEAIYFEARSEVTACQIIVAQTITNRVHQSRFKDSIREVVYQKKRTTSGKWVCQYSYYCDGKPDVMRDFKAKLKSYQVASLVLNNEVLDLSEGADHYYAHRIVTPRWHDHMQDSYICGDHTFGRLEW